MSGLVEVVVGGQYGSEAKGHVVARLAYGRPRLAVVRVAGPNAGHTAYGALDGLPWPLRQVPCAAVVNLDCALVICAGSEVDEAVLLREVAELDRAGYRVSERLIVDHQATVITDSHKAQEAGMSGRIGSTAKGIGAARASRIMREAPLWGDHGWDANLLAEIEQEMQEEGVGDVQSADTQELLHGHLRAGGDVLIEGTQGYGLGLHAGHYPYCTSSDCRAIDFLAMAGISPWSPVVTRVDPWVVLRTYPIRVAGNSGPMFDETDWETLGHLTGGHIKPERTTVTKKVRRVGAWDQDLARRAVQANGGQRARVALTFLDYWRPDLASVEDVKQIDADAWARIEMVEKHVGATVAMVTTGPATGVRL